MTGPFTKKTLFIRRFQRALIAALLSFYPLFIFAGTYYVDASRPDNTGDGTTWATAKKTIQSAVDLARANDLVLVTNGTYAIGHQKTPNAILKNRVVITNSITVQSVNGPYATIIEGSGETTFGDINAVRCVFMSKGILSGFTIQYGATLDNDVDTTYSAYNYSGGGICMFSTSGMAMATNCIVRNCVANSGGGVAGGTIISSIIQYNRAYITDSTPGNAVSRGGGAYSAIVTDCLLANNKAHAFATYPTVFGGGADNCVLTRCSLLSNVADTVKGSTPTSTRSHGGGASDSTLSNCLVSANSAASTGEAYGGGLFQGKSINCTITDNSVAALRSMDAEGGGTKEGTHFNSIIWQNLKQFNGVTYTNNHDFGQFDYCCTSPKPSTDTHGIAVDPLFVSAQTGDYRLTVGSPCLDSGGNGYMRDAYDLPGNARIQNMRIDMGAYEGAFKLPQTITFPSLQPKTYGDAAFAPSASASSGLPVTYSIVSPDVAIYTNGMIEIVGTGSALVIASQPGNHLYAAAPPVTNVLSVSIPPVSFNPAGGTLFTNAVQVYMSNAAPNISIRYTVDGSEPTSASPLFTTPVTLSMSVTLKARPFSKADAGPVSQAAFHAVYSVVITQGTANGVSAGIFPAGTNLTLIAAIPPAGFRFVQWLVTPQDTDLGQQFSPTHPETTITVPPSVLAISAKWDVDVAQLPFMATASMDMARHAHTATLLPDDRVLVAGGFRFISQFNYFDLSNCELYDPKTASWIATGALDRPKCGHTATLLNDGRVLSAGGQSGQTYLSQTELFSVSSGIWAPAGKMTTQRTGHTATLLSDGKVLIAGGFKADGYSSFWLANVEIYDPVTGTWTATAPMHNPRSAHTATLLNNGKVLVSGGFAYGSYLASAELFDPVTGAWSIAAQMETARARHTSTRLPDGQVLVAGGDKNATPSSTAELFDPTTGVWKPTGSMLNKRYRHTAALLPNGKVIVTGGYTGAETLSDTETYNPSNETWSSTSRMGTPRFAHTATLLSNGKLLIAGGEDNSYSTFASTELYGCLVTFNPMGGATDLATKCYYSATDVYGSIPLPQRIGHSFSGWWTDAGNTGSCVSSSTVLTTVVDHTLYAAWSANEYPVLFDPNGGAVSPSSATMTFGQPYGDLPAPFRVGYTFTGWTTITNGVSLAVVSNTVVSTAGAHVLTATWSANTYTVSLDALGGTVTPASMTVTYDTAYGPLPVPTRTAPIRIDYMFAGWFTGQAGTGSPVSEISPVSVAANHTLYAKWTPSPYLCPPSDDEALTTAGLYAGHFYGETPFAETNLPSILGVFTLSLRHTNGTFTAKAQLQRGTLSFSSKTWFAVQPDSTRRASLTARTGERLDLFIRQNRIWGSLTGGSLTTAPLTLDGARDRFADRADAAAQTRLTNLIGYYTLSLPVAAAITTGIADAVPQGSGFLTLTIGRLGRVRIAGRLPDGTAVSQSTALIPFDGCGPDVCSPLFVPLYSRKGHTSGLLWFTPEAPSVIVTDRDLGWFVRWEKPTFFYDGTSVLLDAVGGYYNASTALAAHYRFSAQSNDVPYCYKGGTTDVQSVALPNGIGVTVNGTRIVMDRTTRPLFSGGVYDYSPTNSAQTTFSFTAATGLFRGSFNLYYDYTSNDRQQHKTVRVPYSGVLTPGRSPLFADEPAGQGYYLVPDNDPRWQTSRLKRSCLVTLEAF